MVKVSVVVPTYKRPETLRRAVISIQDQTVDDWELIVVNDAPKCDVRNVLPEDDSIRYIQHEQNRGAPMARNTGIDAADGEFISLLDDDDAWKQDKLDRQLDRLESLPDAYGMVYCGREVVRDGEIITEYRPESTGWIFETLLGGNCIPSETPLIRRECFNEVGTFDPSFESAQDLDMWLRIAREYKIDAIAEPLAIAYRGHDDRISNDMNRKYSGLRRILEKYEHDFERYPRLAAQRYKTLGVYAINADRLEDARSALRRSLDKYLYDPTVVVYLLLTITPDPIRKEIVSLRRSIVAHGFKDGVARWLNEKHNDSG